MLLVIPSIEIKSGKCIQTVQNVGGYVYSDDPIESAKLWRKENTKTLYVTDVDGAIEGRMVNFDVIRTMVNTVDIPITLGGGLRTLEEVTKAFDAGIYRVVISTMLLDEPDEARRVLEAFGPNKVIVGIDARAGIVEIRGRQQESGLPAISVALNARALGFRRIVYTDILRDGTMRGPNFTSIRSLGEKSGMKITAAGGIGGLDDLLKLQELETFGIDSVVIGRALYENKFSCQWLWRMCEIGGYPYTAKV